MDDSFELWGFFQMKLNKVEARVLLSYAKANRDCDLDQPEYSVFEDKRKVVIRKTWSSIIRKLKAAAK
jgi:hypothetical protein